MGESNTFMYAKALGRLQWQAGPEAARLEPGHIAMVGDTLGTDILGGQSYGAKTIWVTRTGFDSLDDLKYFPHVSPTCHVPSVKELAELLMERFAPRQAMEDS